MTAGDTIIDLIAAWKMRRACKEGRVSAYGAGMSDGIALAFLAPEYARALFEQEEHEWRAVSQDDPDAEVQEWHDRISSIPRRFPITEVS